MGKSRGAVRVILARLILDVIETGTTGSQEVGALPPGPILTWTNNEGEGLFSEEAGALSRGPILMAPAVA